MRDELEKFPKEILDAYAVPSPSGDLEERFLKRYQQEGRTHRRRNLFGVAAALLAAAIVLLAVSVRPRILNKSEPIEGELSAKQRTTVSLGEYGIAVAEESSQLSWSTKSGGLQVIQSKGSVFYRVEPTGQQFVVQTPAGEIAVLGTCFQVEVKEMTPAQQMALGGVLGAVTTVLFTVYEGKVKFSNEQGALTLNAGEEGTAANGLAPSLSAEEAQTLSVNDKDDPLRQENEKLKEQVADLREDVKILKEIVKDDLAPDKQFSTEERDEVWAPQEEAFIQDRLERFLKLPKASFELECHQRCCQAVFHLSPSDRDFNRLMMEFQSNVGFSGMAEGMMFGPSSTNKEEDAATLCLKDPGQVTKTPSPDRGAEREALLAAAAPALELCAQELEAPLIVDIELALDKEGQMEDVKSQSDPLGNKTAVCVEKAILAAANFAPASGGSWVPITVRLQPAKK